MGIKQLLPSLKGLQGTYGNFPEPHFKGVRIALDAAGLLHGCARRHLSAYEAKDYGPALAEFQRTMAYLISICCWQCVVVFDGQDSPQKCHERMRRDERQTTDLKAVRNDSLYIAMAAKVCKGVCPYLRGCFLGS